MSGDKAAFQQSLREIADGSEEAARQFVATYGEHIRRIVRKRLGRRMRSKFDSTDFVQMVWKSFFSKPSPAEKVPSPEALRKFLAAMAANKVADEGRKAQVNETHGQIPSTDSTIALNAFIPAKVVDPTTPSQHAIANEALQMWLSDPSERTRTIMQMRMLGATYAEIAERIGGVTEAGIRAIVRKKVARDAT